MDVVPAVRDINFCTKFIEGELIAVISSLDNFLNLNRRLGTVEVSDQLEVSEYLRDTLHFVDKKRMGIWGKITFVSLCSANSSWFMQILHIVGWSYGGYVAALALSTSSIFQCGISVAPVTSWKLYGKSLI